MARNKFTWHGKGVIDWIEGAVMENLKEAGDALKTELRRVVGKPGYSKAAKSFTGTGTFGEKGKKYRKGRKMLGKDVSRPGEPPRKQTGRLQRSVRRKVMEKKKTVRVTFRGSLVEYGTVNMAARPALRPTFERLKPTLAKIATRPAKPKLRTTV